MDTPIIRHHQCKTCGNTYPRTNEFWHKNKGQRDGLSYTCKECAKARARKWEAENVERKKESKRQYYQDNKERIDQQNKEWAKRNPGQRSEIHKRWLSENPDRRKEHANKYARSSRGKANRQQWRENNPERYRALNKASKAKRRALLAQAEGSHTPDDIQLQYKSQKGRCWWCSKKVGDNYHADHLIPLDRGGSNDARNIVISCPHCNSSRQNRLPHEWNGRLL